MPASSSLLRIVTPATAMSTIWAGWFVPGDTASRPAGGKAEHGDQSDRRSGSWTDEGCAHDFP
jgi:hypothetical protein